MQCYFSCELRGGDFLAFAVLLSCTYFFCKYIFIFYNTFLFIFVYDLSARFWEYDKGSVLSGMKCLWMIMFFRVSESSLWFRDQEAWWVDCRFDFFCWVLQASILFVDVGKLLLIGHTTHTKRLYDRLFCKKGQKTANKAHKMLKRNVNYALLLYIFTSLYILMVKMPYFRSFAMYMYEYSCIEWQLSNLQWGYVWVSRK